MIRQSQAPHCPWPAANKRQAAVVRRSSVKSSWHQNQQMSGSRARYILLGTLSRFDRRTQPDSVQTRFRTFPKQPIAPQNSLTARERPTITQDDGRKRRKDGYLTSRPKPRHGRHRQYGFTLRALRAARTEESVNHSRRRSRIGGDRYQRSLWSSRQRNQRRLCADRPNSRHCRRGRGWEEQCHFWVWRRIIYSKSRNWRCTASR
jgi:hypothetical protein